MENLTRVSVTIDSSLLKQFDRWQKTQGFPTRSEAVGHLVRSALIEEEWEADSIVAGVLTIVYDHHKTNVLAKIVEAQHDSGALVLCSQHAHLDHNNCMENIIVRGRVAEIRLLHQKLSAIKGMKHTVLSMTTTGNEF